MLFSPNKQSGGRLLLALMQLTDIKGDMTMILFGSPSCCNVAATLRAGERNCAIYSLFLENKDMPRDHSANLLMFNWLELGHMATPSYRLFQNPSLWEVGQKMVSGNGWE